MVIGLICIGWAISLLVAVGIAISFRRERDDLEQQLTQMTESRDTIKTAADLGSEQHTRLSRDFTSLTRSAATDYNNLQYERRMRSEAQQSLAVERKQKASLLEDLSNVRAELDMVRRTYQVRKEKHIQAQVERDAYKRGLIDVTNLGTRKMAHIGKRMVAAANEALNTGAEL